MLITAAIGLVGGVLGALFYVRAQEPAVRVRVLDMRRIVETIARDPTLDEEARRARTRDVSERISVIVSEQAAQGALILDGSTVLRAPASAYVEP
jgi:hypothetical protein